GEGNPELVSKPAHQTAVDGGIASDLVSQSHHLQSAVVVAAVQPDELRRGIVARRAPTAENVHQHDLPPEMLISLGNGLAIEAGKLEVERLGGVCACHFGR